MSELIHICNRCGEIVREAKPDETAFPYVCPNCEHGKDYSNITEAEAVYVATIEIHHTDLYEQDDDGTVTLGVFNSLDGAMKRIKDEYNRDRDELLSGSCKKCAENLRKINEDESYEPRKDEAHGFGEAYLAVDFDQQRDVDYSYEVRRHIVRD